MNTNTFDWSGIDEKYQWVATDKSGSIYVYSSAPFMRHGYWDYNTPTAVTRISAPEYTDTWSDSLQRRPSNAAIEKTYTAAQVEAYTSFVLATLGIVPAYITVIGCTIESYLEEHENKEEKEAVKMLTGLGYIVVKGE